MGKNNGDTSSTGAKSELIASTLLLSRGYHVFRSISPSGVCDLIALKAPEMLKVEVKTGHMITSKNGENVNYNIEKSKADRFDILIVVLYDDGVRVAVFKRDQGIESTTLLGKEKYVKFSMPIADLVGSADIFRKDCPTIRY